MSLMTHLQRGSQNLIVDGVPIFAPAVYWTTKQQQWAELYYRGFNTIDSDITFPQSDAYVQEDVRKNLSLIVETELIPRTRPLQKHEESLFYFNDLSEPSQETYMEPYNGLYDMTQLLFDSTIHLPKKDAANITRLAFDAASDILTSRFYDREGSILYAMDAVQGLKFIYDGSDAIDKMLLVYNENTSRRVIEKLPNFGWELISSIYLDPRNVVPSMVEKGYLNDNYDPAVNKYSQYISIFQEKKAF